MHTRPCDVLEFWFLAPRKLTVVDGRMGGFSGALDDGYGSLKVVDNLGALLVGGTPSPSKWVLSYEEELAGGNLAAAMVATIKDAGDPSLFTAFPHCILTPLMKFTEWADAKEVRADNASMRMLILTFHFDAHLAEEMAGKAEGFKAVRAVASSCSAALEATAFTGCTARLTRGFAARTAR